MNNLTIDQKTVYHSQIIVFSRKIGAITFISALITILALAAIVGAIGGIVCCGSLNVVSQFILPVILPSCLVLLCVVVPILIYVVKSYKKINIKLKECGQIELNALRSFYNSNVLISPDKNQIAKFLKENIINFPANKLYHQEFLHIIKNLLPKKKERSSSDSHLVEGINRAIENLKLSERQREKRDEREKNNKSIN